MDDDPPVIQGAVSMAPYMDSVLDDGSGWVGDAGTLTAAVRDASPLRYEWWVDGVLLSSGQYFYWRTTGMTARTANVEVKVWDAVGNFASHSYVVNIDNKPPALGNYTTYSRDVIIDNTLPTLRITKAPRNTSKPRKTTTITAAAGDRNGVARVQLLVNGKLVATDSKAGYSFSLNPEKYGKTFTVQLRAYDKAGNVRCTGKLTYHR